MDAAHDLGERRVFEVGEARARLALAQARQEQVPQALGPGLPFSGSIIEGGQAPASTSRCQSARRGTTWVSMKARSCSRNASTLAE